MTWGQSGNGRLLKTKIPVRPCLWVKYSYREKLALNNPDVTYAFTPDLFSTFETHLDHCICPLHRETLTVFQFSPQPTLLWGHNLWGPPCIWRYVQALLQWACSPPRIHLGVWTLTREDLRHTYPNKAKWQAGRKAIFSFLFVDICK